MSTNLANPLWLGPQTYEERDAARFHGRAAETAELLDLIRREPLVLLHGESGHGKSSLLQAGLAPRLREQGALPIILRDLFRKDVPDITAALLAAIVAQAAARDCTAPEPRPGDTLWEYFHRANSWFTGPDVQSLVPVLILDQFEDLFRRCDWRPGDTATPAAHFLAQFADLLENREPAAVRERRLRREGDEFDHAPTALRVLIGLREDALPDLTPLRASIPGLARTPYRLRPLTRASAKEVILRPVAYSPAHAGLLGENPNVLAEDILTRMAPATAAADAAAVQSVDPFLLSVVMDQLQCRADATQPAVITHTLVKDGVAAALDTFYETAVALVPVALRDWLETTAGLVTAGGFRNSVAADDAEHALRDPETGTHLRTLENAHLLRAEPRPDGSLRFELVHDRLSTVLAGKIRLRAEARAEQERKQEEQRLIEETRADEERKSHTLRAEQEREYLKREAELQRQRTDAMNSARKRAVLVAALAFAAGIVAVLFYIQARAAKENAVKQAGLATKAALDADAARIVAEKSEEEASIERNRARAQVKEASRSDTASAQARLAEGKWQEGVAYLGRAIRYDPENRHAQDALWLTLRHGSRDAGALPMRQLEHGTAVNNASFSPDGTRIVTESEDNAARIWDARTGQQLGAPLQHNGRIVSTGFSPDCTLVVTASADQTARIWNAKTGQAIGAPLEQKFIERASFSPDGTRVFTAGGGGSGRVWDVKTGQNVGDTRSFEALPQIASFSNDGTRVVTTSMASTNTVRIWDTKTRQLLGSPLEHRDRIVTARFSPDGTRVVTASQDKTARVWDAKTGQAIGAPLLHKGEVLNARFSPDGTRVVTTCWSLPADSATRIWNVETGLPIGEPLGHKDSVNSESFSPDGTRVVTASADKSARIWDASTGKLLGSLEHEDSVLSACFSPDGTLVVTASSDKTSRIWGAITGKLPRAMLEHKDGINSASFSNDGTLIVTASQDKTARIWDTKTGQTIGAPLGHKDEVLNASFSNDGTRVVTASDDNIARIWDAKSSQPIGAPLEHKGKIESTKFSADDSLIVTASGDKTARIWNAKTGQPIGTPLEHKGGVVSASFNLDGTLVVTAGDDKTARVWNAKTGQSIGAPLEHKTRLENASFSPDGTRVVIVSWNNTAHIWDAETGQLLNTVREAKSGVPRAQFSPDGTRVFTSRELGTSDILNTESLQPVGVLLEDVSKLSKGTFSPDGMRLVIASADRISRIWDVMTDRALPSDLVESLTITLCGAVLDPELGTLKEVTPDGRFELREKLAPFLATSEDWKFIADQTLSHDPKTALVSPRMTMTVREATNRLISTMVPGNIREALGADPGNPLQPFAHATIEAVENDGQPANPIRAAWLVDYGMKRLPADLTAAELRIAGRLIASVAKTLPEQKKHAITLLNRALSLAPEDDETKQLRDSLK